MKTKSKVFAITSLLVIGTLALLGFIWWANGMTDTWLYATSAIIVLSAFIPMLTSNKDKDR